MALAKAEKIEIQEMISAAVQRRLVDEKSEYSVRIHERIVHVEEELKHQRELMEQGFRMMDRRFEQVEKRFEQVDKRFERVDKHFEALTRRIDRFMVWSFGITVSVGGIVVALIKYLP